MCRLAKVHSLPHSSCHEKVRRAQHSRHATSRFRPFALFLRNSANANSLRLGKCVCVTRSFRCRSRHSQIHSKRTTSTHVKEDSNAFIVANAEPLNCPERVFRPKLPGGLERNKRYFFHRNGTIRSQVCSISFFIQFRTLWPSPIVSYLGPSIRDVCCVLLLY